MFYIFLTHDFEFGGQTVVVVLVEQRAAFLQSAREQLRVQLFVALLQTFVEIKLPISYHHSTSL